jgi:23S rRNA (guanosine2251-2'-O)-methyltransferase
MSHFIYGLHAVTAVLDSAPKRATRLWLSGPNPSLIQKAKAQGISHQTISREDLEAKFSDLGVHQGVVLEVKPASMVNESELEALVAKAIDQKGRVTVLALDEVQDPRNLGACLRSAAAYAVDVIVIPKRRSATLTPAAEKVACGGAVFVPVVLVTNFVRTLKALQEQGLWVVGTSLETEQRLEEVDLTGNIVLVMGSEGEGVRELTAKTCDYLVKIPMSGVLPSLNVSAATTVCLYEQLRQQGKKSS